MYREKKEKRPRKGTDTISRARLHWFTTVHSKAAPNLTQLRGPGCAVYCIASGSDSSSRQHVFECVAHVTSAPSLVVGRDLWSKSVKRERKVTLKSIAPWWMVVFNIFLYFMKTSAVTRWYYVLAGRILQGISNVNPQKLAKVTHGKSMHKHAHKVKVKR